MKLSKLFSYTALMIGFSLTCGAKASIPASGKVNVAYFSMHEPQHFETKVKPIFQENVARCKTCEITNMTPYKKGGEVDQEAMVKAIHDLPVETTFVFVDFNLRNNEENKELAEALALKAASGLIVVASAGQPKPQEPSSPLSRTIMGKVQDAFIIGELSERDRLMPQGFYGPEMFTAVRPPKEIMGQGFGPLIFASNLAENWTRRSSEEWVSYLKTKKVKSRKLWLDLHDIF